MSTFGVVVPPALAPENQAAQTLNAPAVNQGIKPGCWSLTLRSMQSSIGILALAAMVSANDFSTFPPFNFFVAACAIQILWAISLALADIYLLLTVGQFPSAWISSLSAFGDGIIPVMTFWAASAASGIILFFRIDLKSYETTNNGPRFEAATGVAFISIVFFLPSIAINWMISSIRSPRDQIMSTRARWLLLYSRVACLVTTFTSQIIYAWNVSSGRIRVAAFSYMYLGLMAQCSACVVLLMGQGIGMCLGSTSPVPKNRSLCFLLILIECLLALFVVGAACASLGALSYFMANGFFYAYVNVRAIIHCGLSLAAGISGAVSAYLSLEIAKYRRRQLHE